MCGICVYVHVCSPAQAHVDTRSSVACLPMLYHTFFWVYLLLNPQCPCLVRLTDQAVSQTLLLLPSSIETAGACQHTLLCIRVLGIWTRVLTCCKPQHYTVITQLSFHEGLSRNKDLVKARAKGKAFWYYYFVNIVAVLCWRFFAVAELFCYILGK